MWWAKEKALTRVLQISAFYVDYRPTTSDGPEGVVYLKSRIHCGQLCGMESPFPPHGTQRTSLGAGT